MTIHTACLLNCPDSCALIVERGEDGPTVAGNPDHPVTQGAACVKARRALKALGREDRIATPLRRDLVGGFRPVSWDEALAECAAKLQAARQKPGAILHVYGQGYRGAAANASRIFFDKLAAARTRGSLCDGAGITASIQDFGALDHNDPLDLANASVIVNWGRELGASCAHLGRLVRQARENKTRVLAITPLGKDAFADRVACVRPGMDRFLAAALILRLRDEARVASEALARVANREAMEAALDSLSVDECLAACDVSCEDFDAIYEAYAAPAPAATLIGWGLQRCERGGENVRWINALALLSGNVGKRGGGAYFSVSSNRNFNLPALNPPATYLESRLGRELIEARKLIDVVWVEGLNAVTQSPESHEVARALQGAPFTVVVEAFMTDTARCADLVLPCALMFEREEITGSSLHNFIHYAAPAFHPPGGARDNYEVLRELGAMLDPAVELPDKAEWFRMALDSPHTLFSFEELKERGFMRAARPETVFADLRFAHPDGMCRAPEALGAGSGRDAAYPLLLLTKVRARYIQSQIPPEEQSGLGELRVSPRSPSTAGLDPDKPAELVTPLGRIRVALVFDESLHPDMATYDRGYWLAGDRCVNHIIEARLTDFGETVAFYSQPCRVENAVE